MTLHTVRVPIRFPIKTPRLTIRPMQLDDAEALLAVYGDVETIQHLNSELPSTVEEACEWVQTKINLFEQDDQLSLWAVIHTESGQIVGDVGLQHEDYGSGPVVGLGGRGNRGFWRQGLGFEAASATIEAGFEQLDLPVIGAETRPENLPAQALLIKLGMRPAGTNTRGWPVYLITRKEWLNACEAYCALLTWSPHHLHLMRRLSMGCQVSSEALYDECPRLPLPLA